MSVESSGTVGTPEGAMAFGSDDGIPVSVAVADGSADSVGRALASLGVGAADERACVRIVAGSQSSPVVVVAGATDDASPDGGKDDAAGGAVVVLTTGLASEPAAPDVVTGPAALETNGSDVEAAETALEPAAMPVASDADTALDDAMAVLGPAEPTALASVEAGTEPTADAALLATSPDSTLCEALTLALATPVATPEAMLADALTLPTPLAPLRMALDATSVGTPDKALVEATPEATPDAGTLEAALPYGRPLSCEAETMPLEVAVGPSAPPDTSADDRAPGEVETAAEEVATLEPCAEPMAESVATGELYVSPITELEATAVPVALAPDTPAPSADRLSVAATADDDSAAGTLPAACDGACDDAAALSVAVPDAAAAELDSVAATDELVVSGCIVATMTWPAESVHENTAAEYSEDDSVVDTADAVDTVVEATVDGVVVIATSPELAVDSAPVEPVSTADELVATASDEEPPKISEIMLPAGAELEALAASYETVCEASDCTTISAELDAALSVVDVTVSSAAEDDDDDDDDDDDSICSVVDVGVATASVEELVSVDTVSDSVDDAAGVEAAAASVDVVDDATASSEDDETHGNDHHGVELVVAAAEASGDEEDEDDDESVSPSSSEVSHESGLLSVDDRSEKTRALVDVEVVVGPSVTDGVVVDGVKVTGVDDAILLKSCGNADDRSDRMSLLDEVVERVDSRLVDVYTPSEDDESTYSRGSVERDSSCEVSY